MLTMLQKKQVTRLAWLFAITYMLSYMTRNNFSAIVAEMETATGLERSALSMSLTGSFITYGAGQVISGVAGDRISPKRLVTLGLLLTVAMNFAIPLCRTPWQMLAVWCVNGFAQSFMWPPIVKLMVAMFDSDAYKHASLRVQWGSSMGTMAVYLVSPLLIWLFSWRSVFVFTGLCGIVGVIGWNRLLHEPKDLLTGKKESSAAATKQLFTPVMLAVMCAIIMMGMLRDGITTWMPSYIAETYRLSNVISILTGVLLPIFSILSARAAEGLHRKAFRNPLLCAGMIFGVGTAAALLLYFLFDWSAAASVILAALLTGCMHGVNFMLISMLPAYFRKYGNTSTVSGVLNACTYIGSALSTYGVAVLSTGIGWDGTILLWFCIALVGTALCLLCVKPWAAKHPVE